MADTSVKALPPAEEAPVKGIAPPSSWLTKAWKSSWNVLLFLMASVMLFFALLKWAPASTQVLHAVPSSELVTTPELVASPGKDTIAQEELFAGLFAGRPEAVFGKPGNISMATDFHPVTVRITIDAVAPATDAPPPSPPPSPYPPSPHPPAGPKPWVIESMAPPRAINASHAKPDGAPGRWAYAVRDVRLGTVLLSNKAFGPDRSYYDGAAILLLKVCGCHPSIFGVILSSPSDETMGSAFCPASKARYPSFANLSIRLGGPVGPHWTLLHGRDDVGAMQVSTGVYIGGSLSQYQRLVLQGTAAPSDVNFYSGYSAWPIERLQREVAAGDWTVLKPSAPLLLDAARGAAAARDVLSLAVAK